VGEEKCGDGCELKFEVPGLRDQVKAEAVDKAKTRIIVDTPSGGEMALCPQRDFFVSNHSHFESVTF
jgi:hypothetical protein